MNETKAGQQLETLLLFAFSITLAAGFGLGWVVSFWVHHG